MLAKLENWIRDFTEDKATAPSGDAEWTRALAGLLVEAAMADGELGEDERVQMSRVLAGQLQLGTAEIDAIINGAVDSHEERVEIYGLARSIRAETEPDDRIAIMEMAWMVVLADGELHDDVPLCAVIEPKVVDELDDVGVLEGAVDPDLARHHLVGLLLGAREQPHVDNLDGDAA